ncbi:MAG: phosphoenolpyruvate--protein phosphotransferase [Planctomycetes bacterium]|nr:phosphoenolpyruvate--protein phosphotransferase [Planctomycetota bacterium]
MNAKKGISASPGVAIGPAFVLDTEQYRIPRRSIDPAGVPQQIRLLDAALAAAREEVGDIRLATARKHGAKMAEIFAFHEGFIADPGLRKAVASSIEANSYTAEFAFAQEMNKRQRVFLDTTDAYLKERVRDLRDIEERVLRQMLGRAREDITRLTQPVVIVAHDILPSKALELEPEHILGFAIDVGGSTSHMAIIARMLEKPTVVALNDVTTMVVGGETLIVDGSSGIVISEPDEDTVNRYRSTQQRAMELGAEGIGLFRSEFLFLANERLPTEEQQYESFRAAVRHARGKPVTIRTIDLGADKMSDYLGAVQEHNPVLGLRSMRYCLHHLDMFKTHLRAILRASAHGDVRIMFPMITTVMEMRQARSTLQDVMEDLEEDGLSFRRDVPVGMMVETPAAAMLASSFVGDTAFYSIGTNDLTQYTLAVDRANERVAYLYAPHNPAVLRLLREVMRAGRRGSVPVTICGEMAGQPLYTELLLGLGIRTLSMAPQDIPQIKRAVRSTSISRCERVARTILRFEEERQVMNFLHDRLRSTDPEAL